MIIMIIWIIYGLWSFDGDVLDFHELVCSVSDRPRVCVLMKVNRIQSKTRVLLAKKANRVLADIVKSSLKKQKPNSQFKYTLKYIIIHLHFALDH
jgi:hypothetical protein